MSSDSDPLDKALNAGKTIYSYFTDGPISIIFSISSLLIIAPWVTIPIFSPPAILPALALVFSVAYLAASIVREQRDVFSSSYMSYDQSARFTVYDLINGICYPATLFILVGSFLGKYLQGAFNDPRTTEGIFAWAMLGLEGIAVFCIGFTLLAFPAVFAWVRWMRWRKAN